MAAARLGAIGKDVRGGLRTVIGVYLFDGFWMAQGAVAAILAAVMILFGLVGVIRGGSARSVPIAKYTLGLNGFFYVSRDGKSARMFYVDVPPFGHPTYLFEEKRWTYID